ncbi:hypothetical protein [Candidatus Odyssella acanthamoebae]|uniref:Autotransporter domain-containing protein n=1 Tax=Candidatus Odyssella acanthamoebae TaxID=91604 RepID=A0A077AUT5_9PROT|nr:hypothetical protein [Candidatus Paracaedibacter acanthamoebae]AIK96171.1 hypothetical protein ID47_04550 [Candidatus Paracaedibacter acanthamoebae]
MPPMPVVQAGQGGTASVSGGNVGSAGTNGNDGGGGNNYVATPIAEAGGGGGGGTGSGAGAGSVSGGSGGNGVGGLAGGGVILVSSTGGGGGNTTILSTDTAVAITGGAGGTGGGYAVIPAGKGSSGGGGAGVFLYENSTIVNRGTIRGGNGGSGRKDSSYGGIGGNGAGGASGSTSSSVYSQGGAGIVGFSGGRTTITNGGTISGGLSGDGSTRTNAITFFGSSNTLILENGYNFVGNIVAGTNGTLTFGGIVDSTFDLVVDGPLFSGFTNFAKQGNSTWSLLNTATLSSTLQLNVGTLQLGNGTTDGAIAGDVNTASGAILAFNPTQADETYSNQISGSGGIAKTGTKVTTLAGINTYSGSTTINAGTLTLGAGGSIAQSSAVNLSSSGARFDLAAAGNQTIKDLTGVNGTLLILGTNAADVLTLGTANSTTFAGSASGNGGITKHGTGILALQGLTLTQATPSSPGESLKLMD